MKAQMIYNKLSSVQQYLMWFDDLDFSSNTPIEEQQQARTEAYDIVRSAKQALLAEYSDRLSVSEAWAYADKWSEIHGLVRYQATRIREALRPILGYV